MVYSNKFVLVVLRKGRPQKELANGVVKIPFGEYALRFRNKNNRRAVVKFFIDGENVSGDGYIIGANSHVDIDCYHATKNKFKFVPLDSEDAVDFGKNGPNPDKVKGTIEARFYLERESKPTYVYPTWPVIREEHHHHHYPKKSIWDHRDKTWDSWDYRTTPITTNLKSAPRNWDSGTDSWPKLSNPHTTYSTSSNSDVMMSMSSFCGTVENAPIAMFDTHTINESKPIQDGCTVEGSRSDMTFVKEWIDYDTENYVSLKVFLQGYEAPEEVEEVEAPKTVVSDRKQTKNQRKLTELEEENERLRRLLAEKENAELKAKLGIKD